MGRIDKIRIAQVGAGVVILPDTNCKQDLSENEMRKALHIDEKAPKEETKKVKLSSASPYDDREPDMFTRKSIREVGRIMGLSQEKTRRLLIEGGWYSTQETRSVRKLMRQGLKDDEIAKELDIPVKKVSSLKPYKDSRIYGIGTVSAQKNRMYRRRKSEDEHSVVG